MATHAKTRFASVAIGLALLLGTLVACGSGSPSPNELRAKTKSVLVRGGMSSKQADCYVGSLSNEALKKFNKGDASAAKDPDVIKRATKCFENGN